MDTIKSYVGRLALTIALAGGASLIQAGAQPPFSLKPHVEIGLGNAACFGSNSFDAKNTSNEYGVDFGYTFYNKGNISWGANIGLGISTNSIRFNTPATEYSYQAGAEADMDGDPYIRHCRVTALEEKVGTTNLTIPLYADFRYRFSDRVSLYAPAGFKFSFKTSAKVKSLSGGIDSWGVYPQYDNLLMADEWLNEFGPRELTADNARKPSAKGFGAGILVGVGAEIWLTGPMSLNLGFGYEAGLTGMFSRSAADMAAPVTYTVADGLQVADMAGGADKCRLSRFALSAGLTFRF